MGILFATGFDHYTTPSQRWNTVVGAWTIQATGRNSPNLVVANVGGSKYLRASLGGQYATVYHAFAFQMSNVPIGGGVSVFASLLDISANSTQLSLVMNNVGVMSVYRGFVGTLLGTVSGSFLTNVWYHVEIKATIDPSAGVVEVRINGATRLSLTGINTRNSANSWVDTIAIEASESGGTSNPNHSFDDVIVSDSAFSGDVSVKAYYPTSAGVTDQWIASSLTTFQCVDETVPNSDGDYASTPNSGDLSLWTFNFSLGVNAAIKAVQTLPHMKKTDAGTGQFLTTLRVEGVNYQPGSAQSPSNGTYTYFPEIFPTYPGTTAPWSLNHVRSMQVGPQRTA